MVATPVVADAAASASPRPARQRRRVRSGRPASRRGRRLWSGAPRAARRTKAPCVCARAPR